MTTQPIHIQRSFRTNSFIVAVNGKWLVDARGITRRFGSETAAEAAAVKGLAPLPVQKAHSGNEVRALKIFRTMTADQQAQLFAKIAADPLFPDEARRIAGNA